MSDVLERICADKKAFVAARKASVPLADLQAQVRSASRPRGFRQALLEARSKTRYGLICELKKASPSKGLIRPDFDVPTLARAYADGGAACLSVLTDEKYFQGRDQYLIEARAAVDLPCLRKDFMLDTYQITESRAIGADCVLLIMAALSDAQAEELEACASEYRMDVLIEVHDGAELERALRLRSPLLGINNRNLKTLEVDLATTEELADLVEPGRLVVSESGLYTAKDLARMTRAGAGAFLIGESLMRQADVRAATAALAGVPASASA